MVSPLFFSAKLGPTTDHPRHAPSDQHAVPPKTRLPGNLVTLVSPVTPVTLGPPRVVWLLWILWLLRLLRV